MVPQPSAQPDVSDHGGANDAASEPPLPPRFTKRWRKCGRVGASGWCSTADLDQGLNEDGPQDEDHDEEEHEGTSEAEEEEEQDEEEEEPPARRRRLATNEPESPSRRLRAIFFADSDDE